MLALHLARLSSFGMVVLIWLVQTIIYPAFYSIDVGQFTRWHAKYTQSMLVIVFPLMSIQAIALAWCLVVQINSKAVIAAILILICWITTGMVSVPIHEQLQTVGPNQILIDRLICTNWIRTIGWTVAFGLLWR